MEEISFEITNANKQSWGPDLVFHPFLHKTSNDNTNRLNFGYYFVIGGERNLLSYLFTFKT